MKTELVIDEDLKPYLTEDIDRSNMPGMKEFYEKCDVDSFNRQWIFTFDNGYGASVIKHWGSYGFDDDLFELAILKRRQSYL